MTDDSVPLHGVRYPKMKEALIKIRDRVRRPDRQQYTFTEISEYLEKVTHATVSRQLISKWFSPDEDRLPTDRQIPHIAAFFGVTKDFFYDEEVYRAMMKQIDHVLALRNVTSKLGDEDAQVLLRSLDDEFTPEQAKQLLDAVARIKTDSDAEDENIPSAAGSTNIPLPSFRAPGRES
ncbi:hypothetical protein ACIQUM_36425 [Amycolatopsis azurea]|uniref:hypothetical protein n=1 Tax=Amycolatopsis azurea TaxID=36819 RepID=UPI00382EA256